MSHPKKSKRKQRKERKKEVSSEYGSLAQSGRGVESAGVCHLPAHNLRLAPRGVLTRQEVPLRHRQSSPGCWVRPRGRRPLTGGGQGPWNRHSAIPRLLSQGPRSRPYPQPSCPPSAFSWIVLVPLSIFSLATAPRSFLPTLGISLNSFSLFRSLPVSLTCPLIDSLHRQSLHTYLTTICHFRWCHHASFSSPHLLCTLE